MSSHKTARIRSAVRVGTVGVLGAVLIAGSVMFAPSSARAAAGTGLQTATTTGVTKFGTGTTATNAALTRVRALRQTPVVNAQPISKAKLRKAAKLKAKKAKARRAKIRWKSARVSWYGPGLYGNGMAGGGRLTRTSMVVAHRTLPFGTKIQFRYRGRVVNAVVKDRGPFIRGRVFDLGPGTARKLHFSGVGTVKWRIIKRR